MLKTFENRDGWIWFDGQFVKWNEAKTHIINQGLHYASAVFEGERAYSGKIFKSEEHTNRFFNSAKISGTFEFRKSGQSSLNVTPSIKVCFFEFLFLIFK